MHPDALIVRTQVYHSDGKIVTLVGKVFFKLFTGAVFYVLKGGCLAQVFQVLYRYIKA